jgi:hypothetical protein
MMTTSTIAKALGLILMVIFTLLGSGIAQQQQAYHRQTEQKQHHHRRVATTSTTSGNRKHEGRQRRSSASLSSSLPIFEIEEDHTPFYEHNELEIELGMILTEDMHHWERVLQQSLSMQ